MTSAAHRAMRAPASPPASELDAAARTAAEDEVADTMAKRLVPINA